MARGSIIQRGKTYRVMVSYIENGKRVQVTKTAPSMKKAEKLRTELLSRADSGTLLKPSKLTIQHHFEQWLKDYSVSLSPRTQELYNYILRKHILPKLGNTPITQLKPQQIQSSYTNMIISGLSPRTVQICHNLLHKGLANAVKTGIIPRNPIDMVDSPRIPRHEIRFMSEIDMKLFLDEARKSEYYALFFTLLFTGMRRGEALALRWSDVDLLGCQLSINRSMQYLGSAVKGKRITFKQPKTASSRRVISLTPSTCVVLKLHREAQNEKRLALELSISTKDDLVFSHFDGNPYLPCTISHSWAKLVRKCGLKGIRLHDARHSHASLMLKAGIHPKIVQERLGHSSFNTTMNIYSHVSQGMQQQAANRFDELVISESVTNPLPINK